jgi:hypothetical protein
VREHGEREPRDEEPPPVGQRPGERGLEQRHPEEEAVLARRLRLEEGHRRDGAEEPQEHVGHVPAGDEREAHGGDEEAEPAHGPEAEPFRARAHDEGRRPRAPGARRRIAGAERGRRR